MDWPEQLALGLPPPRDDEPPELRSAIIAEVCDHLQCALRRELLIERDPVRAKQRVLDSFGDPVAMVCRLWYDAMKEKIMSQRIMLAFSGLMTAACVGMCVLVVLMFRDARAVNALLVAKLESLTPPASSAAPAWPEARKPFAVRLAYDTVNGMPAAGASVSLFECKSDSNHYELARTESSNADGVADFGLVPDGRYRLLFETPKQKYHLIDLNITGLTASFMIVCPSSPRRTGRVRFAIETPASHQHLKNLLWGLTVVPLGEQVPVPTGKESIAFTWWDEAPVAGFRRAENYFWDVTLDADGRARRCLSPSSNRKQSFGGGSDPTDSWYNDGAKPHVFSAWLAPNDLPKVEWPAMEYAIIEVVCVDMDPLQRAGGSLANYSYGHSYVNDLIKDLDAPGALSMEQRLGRSLEGAKVPRFSVNPNGETVCKLELPDDFWRQIPMPTEPSDSTNKP